MFRGVSHRLSLSSSARLLGLSMLARTPEAAIGLLVILRVRELGGSFALAGLVTAVIAGGLAVGAPVLGRLVDRRGQTVVLLGTGCASSIAVTAAAVVPRSAVLALLGVAAVLGLCAPPIAACARAVFARATDPERRSRLLAMDAALQEVSFTAGPLLFVSVLGSISTQIGLFAAALLLLAGTLFFATSVESRRSVGSSAPRVRGGALASAPIRTLTTVAAAVGAMFGATEVALVAVAGHHGGASILGVLIVVWSVPSMIAGLVVARLGLIHDPPRALVGLLATAAVATIGVGLSSSLAVVVPCLAIAGAIAAPLFAATYTLVAGAAPEGRITEANTWVASGLYAGFALGEAGGGTLITASGVEGAFLAGGAAAMIAALLVTRRIAELRRVGTTAAAIPAPGDGQDVIASTSSRVSVRSA